MPRMARVTIKNGMYHIICKSNSDSLLFREESDKRKYLQVLKRYKSQYGVRIHAFCCMDNHVHFILEICGAELASFMKSLNVSYVQYYNRKYDRKGSLMGERYSSKLIQDQKNLFFASMYIHRNAKDILKWKYKLEKYPYSSLGIYLGLVEDDLNLITREYTLGFFSSDSRESIKIYAERFHQYNKQLYEIEYSMNNMPEFENRSERKIRYKSLKPKVVIDRIANVLKIDKRLINVANNRETRLLRIFTVFFLRKYSGFNQKAICREIGNITQSTISRMCSEALKYIHKYSFDDFFDEMDTEFV